MNSVGENINMKQADWQACARVLVVGFRQEGYFPVQLAPPFLQFALNGDDAVHAKSLLDAFMEFIPECEREVFSRAETDFQALDEDDLLEALEAHNVRVEVTSSNVQAVLKEAAHKEIIQAPAYVARCWHGIMQELKPLLTMSFDKMRERMSPNTERVLHMLQFPDEMKQGMPETAKMLRRYVRSLSKEKLRRFFRFLTGSDVLLWGKKITVRFVVQSYFTRRRPIPHKCGCVLEPAYDFNSFMDFRSEFNKVLESNVWVMDIV